MTWQTKNTERLLSQKIYIIYHHYELFKYTNEKKKKKKKKQPGSKKSGSWQAHWLDLMGINLCAKNYRSIPNGSKVMPFFVNRP